MKHPASARQLRIMRVLTMVCFFHFSGLNNGFAFFAVLPGQVQPVNFAPVALHSIAFALNPSVWMQIPQRILGSASRRVLQGMRSQSGLVQSWLKTGLSPRGCPAGPSKPASDVPLTWASHPLSPNSSPGFSWLKFKRLDLLDWDRELQPLWAGERTGSEESRIQNDLKARPVRRAIRPRFMRRIRYSLNDDDGAAGRLIAGETF